MHAASSTSTRPTGSSPGTVGPPGQRTFFLQASEGAARHQRLAREAAGARPRRPRQRPARRASPAARRRRPTPRPRSRTPRRWTPRSRTSSGSARWPGAGTPSGRSSSSSATTATTRTSRRGRRPVDRRRGRPRTARSSGSSSAPAAARAFARRAQAVVAAGRPPCPFCGGPLDPDGPHLPARQRLQALSPSRAGDSTEPGLDAPAAGETSRSRAGSSTPPTSPCSSRLERRRRSRPARSTSRSRGERPLWDFPDGHARRPRGRRLRRRPRRRLGRRAAHRAARRPARPGLGAAVDRRPRRGSRAPGGRLVDLVPGGEVEPGWLPVLRGRVTTRRAGRGRPRGRPDLRRVAVLDVVLNNADRKGSHLPAGRRGCLWGFDHGLTFHEEPKLRTVLWGWAGEPLPDVELSRLERPGVALDDADQQPGAGSRAAARPGRVDALRARVAGLLRTGRFPRPGNRWPAVPWPPL